jgi:hypothetical protein
MYQHIRPSVSQDRAEHSANFSLIACRRLCAIGIRTQGWAKPTAFGGDRFAVVLDFEFLSRSASPSKK